MYKTVYVDSATLGVQLADSAAEPIRQFYVQYRPTGEEALCQVERADLGLLCINAYMCMIYWPEEYSFALIDLVTWVNS